MNESCSGADESASGSVFIGWIHVWRRHLHWQVVVMWSQVRLSRPIWRAQLWFVSIAVCVCDIIVSIDDIVSDELLWLFHCCALLLSAVYSSTVFLTLFFGVVFHFLSFMLWPVASVLLGHINEVRSGFDCGHRIKARWLALGGVGYGSPAWCKHELVFINHVY